MVQKWMIEASEGKRFFDRKSLKADDNRNTRNKNEKGLL